MQPPLDIVISIALNMLVFGGIIYGLLARPKGKPLAVRFAILLPLAANLALLSLESEFLLEQRLVGAGTTLGVAALLFMIARRRGMLAPQTSEIDR